MKRRLRGLQEQTEPEKSDCGLEFSPALLTVIRKAPTWADGPGGPRLVLAVKVWQIYIPLMVRATRQVRFFTNEPILR
jgi:hypothetical protein